MRKCRDMESSSRNLSGQFQARAADGASLPSAKSVKLTTVHHDGRAVLTCHLSRSRVCARHAAPDAAYWPVSQTIPYARAAVRDAARCVEGEGKGFQVRRARTKILSLSSVVFKKWVTTSVPWSDEEDGVTWWVFRPSHCARCCVGTRATQDPTSCP